VFAAQRTGVVLGAAILGARAGEMIGELALAIRQRLTLARIAAAIHPYPSYGSGVRRAADLWESARRPNLMRSIRKLVGR
jgi:pyruvate/2-oxoglutarate dehydrogenase complex dihydrolipoamide dehydrogenase (E3) component